MRAVQRRGLEPPPPLTVSRTAICAKLRIELHAEYDYSWLCISLNLHRDMWGPQDKPNWRDIYHHCNHHHHRHHDLYVTSRDTAPGWWWWWWWWSHGWRWRADPWTSNVSCTSDTSVDIVGDTFVGMRLQSGHFVLCMSLNFLILSLLSVCLSVCSGRISSETAEQIWLKFCTEMEVCLWHWV